MVFPYIKFTHIYNDDNAEKYKRIIYLYAESIEYFSAFEICSNGVAFKVEEDEKEILKRIKNKLIEFEEEGLLGSEDD